MFLGMIRWPGRDFGGAAMRPRERWETGQKAHPSPHFLHDGEDVLVCERGGCDRRRSVISAVLARGGPPRTTPAPSGENHATQLPTRRTDLALAPHLSH